MDSYIDLIASEPDTRIKIMITRDFSNILINYEKRMKKLKHERLVGNIIVFVIAVPLLFIFRMAGWFEIGVIVGIGVLSFGLLLVEDICGGNIRWMIEKKQRERKKRQ